MCATIALHDYGPTTWAYLQFQDVSM